MLFEFFKKPVAWLIGAVIVMVAGLWLISAITSGQRAKAEAKLGRNTADATLDAVEVANAVADDLDKTEAQIDAETKELVDEVLSAPPGHSNAAARRAVCGMRAYRDSSECAGVRAGRPEGAAGARPAR